MKPLPLDHAALNARIVNAFCEDLEDWCAGRSERLQRSDAIREMLSDRPNPLSEPSTSTGSGR